MYCSAGNLRVSVAPDLFLVIGVEDRIRMRYLVWEECKVPDFVLEVASTSTRREDLGPKREVCARLGVKECCTYDPTGEHVTPVLRGMRLGRTFDAAGVCWGPTAAFSRRSPRTRAARRPTRSSSGCTSPASEPT